MNSILSSLSFPAALSIHANPASPNPISLLCSFAAVERSRRAPCSPLPVSYSSDNPVVNVASTTNVRSDSLRSASDVVRDFYDGINRHDLTSVYDLIAEDCVYEDLIFPSPFVGRKDILGFFKRFNDSISTDLQFVIDGLSTEDSSAVGVLWHLEWKGKAFPFSRGCSFYHLDIADGKRQIIYGRDSVEPAIKPGEMALIAIRGVTWLLERFPPLANLI